MSVSDDDVLYFVLHFNGRVHSDDVRVDVGR